MKIGKKLIIMIIALNLAGTGILVASLLRLAQGQITTLVNNEITNRGEKNSKEIQAWLELYMDAVRTVAQIMEQYEELEIGQRRLIFNMMVRAMVEKNPEIAAASNIWEPNALDGLDAQYANTEGTDASGRFIPYWYRTQSGIFLDPLVDYETPGGGDYYLITTVTVPIKNRGRFVGP
jgi:methyl-accepting chemotaxis protein